MLDVKQTSLDSICSSKRSATKWAWGLKLVVVHVDPLQRLQATRTRARGADLWARYWMRTCSRTLLSTSFVTGVTHTSHVQGKSRTTGTCLFFAEAAICTCGTQEGWIFFFLTCLCPWPMWLPSFPHKFYGVHLTSRLRYPHNSQKPVVHFYNFFCEKVPFVASCYCHHCLQVHAALAVLAVLLQRQRHYNLCSQVIVDSFCVVHLCRSFLRHSVRTVL